MCVGVTVALAPPSALAAGYYLWHCGQNFVMSRSSFSQFQQAGGKVLYDLKPPPQSFLSFGSGIATLSGSYLALDHCIHRLETASASTTSTSSTTGGAAAKQTAASVQQTSKYFLPHKAAPGQAFRPPQTVTELMERLGPPLLSRLGAVSFSFFCAGVVQTYVADCLQ